MNSLDSVISTLLSDKNTAKTLENLLTNKNENATPDKKTSVQNEKSSHIQRKIEILKAIEPMIGEKNSEHIRFFIKVLSIAKLIIEMDWQNYVRTKLWQH